MIIEVQCSNVDRKRVSDIITETVSFQAAGETLNGEVNQHLTDGAKGSMQLTLTGDAVGTFSAGGHYLVGIESVSKLDGLGAVLPTAPVAPVLTDDLPK